MINPCCCGQFCPGLTPVDAWENITRVAGYVSATPVEPYGRVWHRESSTHSCVSGEAMVPPVCGFADGKVACAWEGYDGVLLPSTNSHPTGIQPCSAAAGEMIDQVIDNCYRKRAEQTTIARTCRGWKGVAARVDWPGIPFGFTDCTCDCFDASACTPPANPQFKYASIRETAVASATISVTTYDPDPDFTGTVTQEYSHSWDQTATVDRFGNITRVGEKNSHIQGADSLDSGSDYDLTDNCDGSYAIGLSSLGFGLPEIPAPETPITITCDAMAWNGNSAADAAALTALEIFAPPASGTTESSGERLVVVASGTPAVFERTATKLSVNYSGTYSHTRTLIADDSLLEEKTVTWSYSWSQELSGAILFSEVYDDTKELLDLWRLQDDAVYPWRVDNATWLVPLVVRDSSPSVPNIRWNTDEDCAFYQETPYTGEIRGAPMPAGYEDFFDFSHVSWHLTNDGVGNCTPCEYDIGAWPPTTLPVPSATHWPNANEGGTMFGQGAHAAQALNYQFGSAAVGRAPLAGIVLQKWAETLEAWPSVNFSRPCGADRNAVDRRADCASTTPRWSPTPRAICGHLDVLTAAQAGGAGTEVTITTAGKHYLLASGDAVDFTSVGGLGSNVAATRVNDTVFTVPFAGTLAAYAGGGTVRSYLASPGSPDPRDFNDTCPDHRYLVREWIGNYRANALDGGEPTELESALIEGTKEPNATHPTVLWCSPNAADTFEHGVQATWNGDISADICFGEEWHLDFVQVMDDPFWLPDSDCGTQDTTPCAGDGDYAYPPQVEPLTTLPGGYPALAVGITLYPATGHAMPDGVGYGDACSENPVWTGSILSIRALWLLCDDWREPTNHNCASL